MDPITPPDELGKNPQDDKSPLEFFAAYIPGNGKQRHYLGNGKTGQGKGIRLFKSEQAAREYLSKQLEKGFIPLEAYEQIIIHSIEGKLALPQESDLPAKKIMLPRINLSAPDHLKPITTLHKPSAPTAMELLFDYQRKKRRRRR